MNCLTPSWDDTFSKSSFRPAEIFEKYGLCAEFNVISTAHLPDNALPVNMQRAQDAGGIYGDFDLWNELQARGHVIQPRGFRHANKSALAFEEALGPFLRCLEHFSNQLIGFEPASTIFALPYNVSSPELEAWRPSVTRAIRMGPGLAANDIPPSRTVKLTASGWQEAETRMEQFLLSLFERPEGWLIYNARALMERDGDLSGMNAWFEYWRDCYRDPRSRFYRLSMSWH